MPTFMPGWNFAPRWANDDGASRHRLAAVALNTEIFGVGIAPVARRAAGFFVRHFDLRRRRQLYLFDAQARQVLAVAVRAAAVFAAAQFERAQFLAAKMRLHRGDDARAFDYRARRKDERLILSTSNTRSKAWRAPGSSASLSTTMSSPTPSRRWRPPQSIVALISSIVSAKSAIIPQTVRDFEGADGV